MPRSQLVRIRADNLLGKCRLPPPIVISKIWAPKEIQERIEDYIKDQIGQHFCKCTFLGQKFGDKYQADPTKWEGATANTKALVYFSFDNVKQAADDKPYVVSIRLYSLLYHDRNLKHPLSNSARYSYKPRFTLEFLRAFADARQKGAKYAGLLYDNCDERPEYRLEDVPNNGLDMLDEPVNWTLASGTLVCRSLAQFKSENLGELEKDADESYREVGGVFGYEPLGLPIDDEQDKLWNEYRETPGPICQKLWETIIDFKRPDVETDACWWVTNMTAKDKEEEPKFLCRSLATLRVILGNTRAFRLTKRVT